MKDPQRLRVLARKQSPRNAVSKDVRVVMVRRKRHSKDRHVLLRRVVMFHKVLERRGGRVAVVVVMVVVAAALEVLEEDRDRGES